MQDKVNIMGKVYATRQKAYCNFMEKINLFLVAVKKKQKQLMEKIEKQKNPFSNEELKKKQVPHALRYGDEQRGSEILNIRMVEKHDVQDEEERRATEKVRCFLSNVTWQQLPNQAGGITWLELYVLYALHGGCRDYLVRMKEKPLSKVESLQSALANFKRRIRRVMTSCTDEDDEWQMRTCYAVSNRLDKIAITNKHTAIQGLPILEEEDAKLITTAILAMRGINQKRHKDLWMRGLLRLMPRPMAYKGTAHAWLRNLGSLHDKLSWVDEPPLPDGPAVQKVPLSTIICPMCQHMQDTEHHELRSKLGFHQLTCQRCRQVSSTRQWRCACRLLWYKCDKHVHHKFLGMGKRYVADKRGKKRPAAELYGVDKPLPKKRIYVPPESLFESSDVTRRVRLEPGSKLAQRFPHLVKRG